MRYLSVEIGDLDNISVNETDGPGPCSGDVSCCGASQSTSSDEENLGLFQPQLACSILASSSYPCHHLTLTFDSHGWDDQLPPVSLILLRQEGPFPGLRVLLVTNFLLRLCQLFFQVSKLSLRFGNLPPQVLDFAHFLSWRGRDSFGGVSRAQAWAFVHFIQKSEGPIPTADPTM